MSLDKSNHIVADGVVYVVEEEPTNDSVNNFSSLVGSVLGLVRDRKNNSSEFIIPDEISDFFDKIYLDFCDSANKSIPYLFNGNLNFITNIGEVFSNENISLVKKELSIEKTYFELSCLFDHIYRNYFSSFSSKTSKVNNKKSKNPVRPRKLKLVRLEKKLNNLCKEEIESINSVNLGVSSCLYNLEFSLLYTNKSDINLPKEGGSLLFINLIKLYNQDILDKKYIFDLLAILFLHNLTNHLYFNTHLNGKKRLSSCYVFILQLKKLKEEFISNFRGYPFEMINDFLGVDFDEEVLSYFINSLAGKKLRDISPDEKRISIGRIVLQNHKLFCNESSIGYPKLFDYLCLDLSQEKYSNIEKYLLENKGKNLSQENLLFLFENNLEVYDLGEKRELTICVIGLFEEKVLNLENLKNLLIPENLEYVTNSGLSGEELKKLVCSVIKDPDYFEKNKNNNTDSKVEMLPINCVPKEEKITTNVNYKGSKVLPPENNILYLQNELKAEFGKDNFELLGLGELVEESIKMILKIGQILGNKKLKERFIFVGDGNIRDIDINKLEQVYRVLDFFSMHSIDLWLVLGKLISCSSFEEGFDRNRIDYVFKKLKLNKLPEGYKVKDIQEFIDIVLAYLEYGDESIINSLATNSKNCQELQIENDYDRMMISILEKGNEEQINEFGRKIDSLIKFLLVELNPNKHTTLLNGRKSSKRVRSKNVGSGNNAQLLVIFIGKLKIQNGENYVQYLNRIKHFNVKSILGDCFVRDRKIAHFINVFKDLETYFFSFMFHLGSQIRELELNDVENLSSLQNSYNGYLKTGIQKYFLDL